MCGSHLISDLKLSPTKQRLLAANGTPITLLGTTDITLELQSGQKLVVNVVVSDAVDELILGASFLAQHKCVWDFNRGEITMYGKSMQLYRVPSQFNGSCRRIFCASDVSIPAHHVMEAAVHIARPTLKQDAADWAVELNKLPGSIVASRALVRDDAVQVFIKLINLSDEKFTIRRDSFIGTAEPVQLWRETDHVTGRSACDRTVSADDRARSPRGEAVSHDCAGERRRVRTVVSTSETETNLGPGGETSGDRSHGTRHSRERVDGVTLSRPIPALATDGICGGERRHCRPALTGHVCVNLPSLKMLPRLGIWPIRVTYMNTCNLCWIRYQLT